MTGALRPPRCGCSAWCGGGERIPRHGAPGGRRSAHRRGETRSAGGAHGAPGRDTPDAINRRERADAVRRAPDRSTDSGWRHRRPRRRHRAIRRYGASADRPGKGIGARPGGSGDRAGARGGSYPGRRAAHRVADRAVRRGNARNSIWPAPSGSWRVSTWSARSWPWPTPTNGSRRRKARPGRAGRGPRQRCKAASEPETRLPMTSPGLGGRSRHSPFGRRPPAHSHPDQQPGRRPVRRRAGVSRG